MIARRFLHHRVICADCTVPSSYRPLLASKKADVLITDPPYCLLERKRANGMLRDNKPHQKKIDLAPEVPRYENLAHYRRFTEKWLRVALSEGLQLHAPLIIWTNFLGKRVILDVCKELNYSCVGEFAWAKLSLDSRAAGDTLMWNTTQSEVPLRVYEVALIFQSRAILNELSLPMNEVLIRGNISEKTRSVIRQKDALPWVVASGYHDIVNGVSVLHKHPCHKPLSALSPLIHNWTLERDIVLDPFAGSGAIGDAVYAARGEREYRGMEILNSWADNFGFQREK